MDKKKIVLTPMERKIRYFVHLRWACRLMVLLATGTSIWANWLHSEQMWIPIGINILPPLIVLAGFEFTSRVPPWEGPWYHPRRWVRPLAMVGITGIGAWLSYWHQNEAFLTYSRDKQTAMLLPLAIDGLMIIASVAVLDLNVRIDQLQAFKEAGQISTYIPPRKTEVPTQPLKKEQIVAMLKKSPELTLTEIAGRANATLPYVQLIARETGDSRATEPRRRRSRNRNQDLAVATATTSVA
jgi:hypothetical protein